MKHAILLVAAVLLFAVDTYAQTPIDMYGVDTATANRAIQKYHGLFNASKGSGHAHKDATISQYNRSRTSFVIPASTLLYLINNKNCDNIVIELGYGTIVDPGSQKNEEALQLYYTGLQSIDGHPNEYNQITLDTLVDNAMRSYVFDNTAPCPTCIGVGPHQVNGSFQKAVVRGVLKCPSCQPAVNSSDIGTITPDADEQFDFGKTATVNWTINTGYTIKRVLLNGVDVCTSNCNNSWPIQHAIGYNRLEVEVVPAP